MSDVNDPSIQDLIDKLRSLHSRLAWLAVQHEELRRQYDEIVAQRDQIAEQLMVAEDQARTEKLKAYLD